MRKSRSNRLSKNLLPSKELIALERIVFTSRGIASILLSKPHYLYSIFRLLVSLRLFPLSLVFLPIKFLWLLLFRLRPDDYLTSSIAKSVIQ